MTEQQTDRERPMTNHDRMNYWWRRATQAEAELDSWMTRAYEAEGKLWKAEARIKAVRELHSESRIIPGTPVFGCAECGEPNETEPCATIRALDS